MEDTDMQNEGNETKNTNQIQHGFDPTKVKSAPVAKRANSPNAEKTSGRILGNILMNLGSFSVVAGAALSMLTHRRFDPVLIDIFGSMFIGGIIAICVGGLIKYVGTKDLVTSTMVQCEQCGTTIQPATANQTDGLCIPCSMKSS